MYKLNEEIDRNRSGLSTSSDCNYCVGTNFVVTDSNGCEVVVMKGSYSSNIMFPILNSQGYLKSEEDFNCNGLALDCPPVSESMFFLDCPDCDKLESKHEHDTPRPLTPDPDCEVSFERVPSFFDRILAPPTAFADHASSVNTFNQAGPSSQEKLIDAGKQDQEDQEWMKLTITTTLPDIPNPPHCSPLSSWNSNLSVLHQKESSVYSDAMGWGQPNVGKRCRSDDTPDHNSGYSASESETDEEMRAHLMNKRSRDVSPVRTVQAVTDFALASIDPPVSAEGVVSFKNGKELVSESTDPSSSSFSGESCRSNSVISTTTHLMTAQEYSHVLDQTNSGNTCYEIGDYGDNLPSECFLDSRGNVLYAMQGSSNEIQRQHGHFRSQELSAPADVHYQIQPRSIDTMVGSELQGDLSASSSASSVSAPLTSKRVSPPRLVPRFKGPRVPTRGKGGKPLPKPLHRKQGSSDYTINILKTGKHSKPNGGAAETEQDEEEDDSDESDGDNMEDDIKGLKGDEALEDDASTSTDITLPNIVRKIVPPIRPSYFPFVPPYINFCLHDEKSETLPMEIRKHLKWRMSTITPVVIRKTVSNSGFRLLKKTVEWGGQWGKHMKGTMFRSTLKDYQKLNHLPATFQLGRKDRLWRNIYRFILKYGKTQFGFLPRTYILPHDMKQLKHAWDVGESKGSMWIVKPPAGARGTGIRVINRWNQVPKKRPMIVQQYIAKPLLINDRKFDLRLYVLVTNFHPLRVYLYNDGLVRFAPVKYSHDVKRVSDRYMHLTNYSVNKNCDLYTQNEDANACKGHKWTLRTLWRYLRAQGTDTVPIIKRIEDIVIKTLISAEECITASSFNMPSRYNGYELFGFDIILDESFKPWLLEVNISPSLHSSSPLDLAVKGHLVKEVFNIAGYHLPPSLSKNAKKMFIERLDKDLELEKPTFDKRIYGNLVSKEEKMKQQFFRAKFDDRSQYLTEILETLTPDDIRHLLIAEDELSQCNGFNRIFPTRNTHSYFAFFEGPRYYNMLMDAWESKYEMDRAPAIRRLQELCRRKIHLINAPSAPQPTFENQGDTFDKAENVQAAEKSFLDTTSSESIPVNPTPTAIAGVAAAGKKVTKDYNKYPIFPAAAACVPNGESTSGTTTATTSNNAMATDFIQNMKGSPAAVKMERYVLLQDGGFGGGPRSNNTAAMRATAHHQVQISPGELYPPTKNYRHSNVPEDSRLNSNIINNNVSNNNVSNASNPPVNEYNQIKGVCY